MLELVIVTIVGGEQLTHQLGLRWGEMIEVVLMCKAHTLTPQQLACPMLSQQDRHSKCLTKLSQVQC